MSQVDLEALLPSWLVHLRAERRSPNTIDLYQRGVQRYLQWAATSFDRVPLDRLLVETWVADMLGDGREPETARAYLKAVKLYSAWLHTEGELDADPLAGIKPPKLDHKITPVLRDDQLHALVKACQGPTFRDRRDEALVRLMVETGIRAGEAIALKVADLDLVKFLAVVRMGKGGKARVVPYSPQTARALDRYLRLRRSHKLAATAALWLGDKGAPSFGYAGLSRALKARARAAGLSGFHVHVLRHTAASRWLGRGGSEGGLMSVAGWSRREMLDRYVIAVRAELAAQEARSLDLGDL